MTAMPETVRETLKAQADLFTRLTDQALDLQLEASRQASQHLTAQFDAARAALETHAKATRAFQATWLAPLTPPPAAAPSAA